MGLRLGKPISTPRSLFRNIRRRKARARSTDKVEQTLPNPESETETTISPDLVISEEVAWAQVLFQIDLGEPINTSVIPGRGGRSRRADLILLPFYNSSWEDEVPPNLDDVDEWDDQITFTSAEITGLIHECFTFYDGYVGSFHSLSRIATIDDGWVAVVKALVNDIPMDEEMGPPTIVAVIEDIPYPSTQVINTVAQNLFSKKSEDAPDSTTSPNTTSVAQVGEASEDASVTGDALDAQGGSLNDEFWRSVQVFDGYLYQRQDGVASISQVPQDIPDSNTATDASTQTDPNKETTHLYTRSNSVNVGVQQIDDPARRKNTCLVLGSLADKLIGPRSDLLFTEEIQEFLLSQLRDEKAHPSIILHALLALEKFARTSVAKKKILTALSQEEDLLSKFEGWQDSTESIKAEVGFCAQWSLDNDLVCPNREFGCCSTDPSNNYVILNIEDQSDYLKISPDGLTARCDATTFESVRSTACASVSGMDLGIWYYEVELVTDKIMQIGWATKQVSFRNLEQMGIGDDRYSVAYDGCRRIIWHDGTHQRLRESPMWKPGDIVGTILDLKRSVVHFYLNGVRVASTTQIFESGVAHGGFYAAASYGNFQQCKFNFGNKPFKCLPSTDYARFECFNNYAARLGNNNCRIVVPRQIRLVNLGDVSVNNEDNACILCFDNTANTCLTPCMHIAFCSACLDKLEDKYTCPLCRQEIDERLYLERPVATATRNEISTNARF